MRFPGIVLRLLFVIDIASLCLVLGAWLAWRENTLFMKHVRPALVGASAPLSLPRLVAAAFFALALWGVRRVEA